MAGKMVYRASQPPADNKEEYMTYKSDEEMMIHDHLFIDPYDARFASA
jgi:hypothetical protein